MISCRLENRNPTFILGGIQFCPRWKGYQGNCQNVFVKRKSQRSDYGSEPSERNEAEMLIRFRFQPDSNHAGINRPKTLYLMSGH